MRVEVIHFPKRCAHGAPLEEVRKLSGARWWEAVSCERCREEEADRVEAAIERVRARLAGRQP